MLYSFRIQRKGKCGLSKEYRAGFCTLGCKVSQYETEAIREAFLADGFIEAQGGECADVYVVNTCTVTRESDRKSRQVIRRIAAENPGVRILVIGCYAQNAPQELAAIPGVAYVGGTLDKMQCLPAARALLEARERGECPQVMAHTPLTAAPYEPMAICRAPRTRAYVKIEDGCDCRCTYCAISRARGAVRSRPREEVIAEILRLYEGGTREVVLTGIEVASYGKDGVGGSLVTLLEEVDTLPIDRVRLGSLTPEFLRPEVIARLARLKKLTPHFHLSVQSGSESVLRGMRRRYRASAVLESIRLLREAIPDVMLTADMMVGFPGESKENFAETLAFAEQARFLQMHVFAYSPREGTPAASYPDQVSPEEKRARSHALSTLGASLRHALLCDVVAAKKPLSVLFETYEDGVAVGHSDAYIEVRVSSPRPLHGELISVTPTRVTRGTLWGTRNEIIK